MNWFLSLIKKNFDYKMPDKRKKKESHSELSRTEAFLKDTELYPEQDGETWSVFGDVTGFCYKEGLDMEAARKYADELNRNKKNLDI